VWGVGAVCCFSVSFASLLWAIVWLVFGLSKVISAMNDDDVIMWREQLSNVVGIVQVSTGVVVLLGCCCQSKLLISLGMFGGLAQAVLTLTEFVKFISDGGQIFPVSFWPTLSFVFLIFQIDTLSAYREILREGGTGMEGLSAEEVRFIRRGVQQDCHTRDSRGANLLW